MIFERITQDNIEFAIKVHSELFPDFSAERNYVESFDGNHSYQYSLIMLEEKCIGIIGLYSYSQYPDSAWLGWFGIRKQYRRMKYGTQAIKEFEKTAVKKGFCFARLYTDKHNNDAAISFYRVNGYIEESYYNNDDPASADHPIIIFSKPLLGQDPIPWNNKNIYLTEQIEKQKKQN